MSADNSNRKTDGDEKYSLGILKLAINKDPHIEKLTVDYLKSICNTANVWNILNEAENLKCQLLVQHCFDYIKTEFNNVITTDGFKKLSAEALIHVLKASASFVPDLILFRASVEWMRANPTESKCFPEVWKSIDLRLIEMSEIVTVTNMSKLIDGNVLLDILFEQGKKGIFSKSNVFTPYHGVKVSNGKCSPFVPLTKSLKLTHEDSDDEHVTIDLSRLYMLNYLEMELPYGEWRYWIEVSEDNVKWTCIIDYTMYVCQSVQRLFFTERPVRYIRICGAASTDKPFKILRLETYYSTEPFEVDTETGIVIPSHNVALEKKDATVIQGDGCDTMIGNNSTLYTSHDLGDDPIILQLPQPYLLDSMKLLLFKDRLPRAKGKYSYNIEISNNNNDDWTQVFSEKKVEGWRHAKFDKQPVVFIKLTGTYSTYSELDDDDNDTVITKFAVRHFECPAITKT